MYDTQCQSAYRERTLHGPSWGDKCFQPARNVPSASTQGNSNKSGAQKRYSRTDYHRVVDGQSTDVIEVYTELEPKVPITKHSEHRPHKTHTHRSKKSTKPQIRDQYTNTYEPAHTERYWPFQGPRTWLASEDGCTYYGSEDACSLVPDSWEAGSTTSQPSQQQLLALDPPSKQLLLEARPTTGFARSARPRRDAGSDSSGDTRFSRGRQPHRK